jgi:hypothetical protein
MSVAPLFSGVSGVGSGVHTPEFCNDPTISCGEAGRIGHVAHFEGYSQRYLEGAFSEVCCYSITSRMPSLLRFNSCAPTSPTIISGEVGSADERVLPTQSSANLFDLSAPA